MKAPVILACDPGKINFAYAFLGHETPFYVVESGMLRKTIRHLQWAERELGPFIDEIETLIGRVQNTYNIRYAVIERYMTRLRGNYNNEAIPSNIMVLSTILYKMGVQTYLIPASQWKNHFARHYSNNVAEDIFPPYDTKFTEHMSDAVCIGCWSLDVEFNVKCLPNLVKIWPRRNCDNCFWDYKTDCQGIRGLKPPITGQCKYFHGPCSTCRWQGIPVCVKYVQKTGEQHCWTWRPIL